MLAPSRCGPCSFATSHESADSQVLPGQVHVPIKTTAGLTDWEQQQCSVHALGHVMEQVLTVLAHLLPAVQYNPADKRHGPATYVALPPPPPEFVVTAKAEQKN